MAVTLKEKEELESDNRVLAESYKTVNTQQEALASQLKTLTHEKIKLENDVKKKEQIIETQNKNIKDIQKHMSPNKKGREDKSAINFNPEGPMTTDEVMKMQEELNKLRNESKHLKQRLNKEIDSRK